MGEPLLKILVHIQVIEFAIDLRDHHGCGLSFLQHVLQFTLSQIGIDGEGYEPGPLTGHTGQKPVNTVGALDNDAI